MPIYEYRATAGGCVKCQHGFDRLQKLSEDDLATCPDCGAAITRVIAADTADDIAFFAMERIDGVADMSTVETLHRLLSSLPSLAA